MKKSITFYLFILFFFSIPDITAAQTPQDTASIKATALDYIEGWYSGDAKRMEKALHPQLAKRMVYSEESMQSRLIITSALELVQQTREEGGAGIPQSERRKEVYILDIYNQAASVKVDAGGWIDYMHLAKWNGEWKIINVLWELNQDQ